MTDLSPELLSQKGTVAPPEADTASSSSFHRQDKVTSRRLALRLDHVTRWSFKDTFVWQNHTHDQYEVIIPIRGHYRCRLNGTQLALSPERMLLVKPGDWHEDICVPGLEYLGIRFIIIDTSTNLPADSLLKRDTAPMHQVITLRDGPGHALVKSIADAGKEAGICSGHLQDALLAAFFWYHLAQLPETILAEPFQHLSNAERLRARLEALFAKHLCSNLDLQTMATSLQISVRSLQNKCLSLLGDSPMRLFRAYRIRQAMDLLERSEMPVKKIAYELGFKTPFHFSRVFKEQTGSPPIAFRARLRKAPPLKGLRGAQHGKTGGCIR